MKRHPDTYPPKWAQRLLAWYCKPDLLEDLQGDLTEYFSRNLADKGPGRAKLIFILDVFKFFRSYTIRKPKFLNLLIQWIMIGSYIKTSGRSIVRNPLFSSINIIGLAISMSVGLLMISFISDLTSYDDFHENKDRIYRVISAPSFNKEESHEFASTSIKTGKLIEEKVSGVEESTILRSSFSGDCTYGEKIVSIEGLWADNSFFKIFTFPMLHGDPATALKNPYSIVLTESAAYKIMGNVDALGKTIKFDTTEFVVTGILKDIPQFSHIRFEALGSFATKELQARGDRNFFGWKNMWQNYVYVRLPEGGDPASLQSQLDKISAAENAQIENTTIELRLQPMKEIALGKDLSNQLGPAMMISVVWVIGGLALMVILSACFNYTNLSIARSLRRSKEVGIRKVIGALRGHVLGQFVAEAVIISLLSLAFSFFIFMFLRPQFLAMAPELQQIVVMDLSPKVIGYFVIFAMLVGVLAGFLPALFFSRINAVQVLKDVSSMKVFRHISMRRALIVVQYTFSLIFITTTFIGYKQYKSFLSFDLGFNTENILNINLQGNKAELLVKELNELPEVTGISKSLMITSVGNYYGSHMKYQGVKDSLHIWFNAVDDQYIPLHGHKLVAGKNLSPRSNEAAEDTEVVVNEQILRFMDIGLANPEKAIGGVVRVDGKDLTIVGVLKDFHYGKADNKIEPVVFRYSDQASHGFVNARIITSDVAATMTTLEKAWRKIDKVHPLDAKFYSDQIERAYSEFSAMLKIIGFLAFLAISIASLGLFGMVVFTTETKLKEISIRKVLGASEGNLIYLLSRGFLLLLTASAFIALPATYLFFDQVLLPNFAYHPPIGLVELLAGFLAVMAIAFLMIGSQTLKVARTNPAQVLKNE